MKKFLAVAAALVVLAGFAFAVQAANEKKADGQLLSHNVYFALKESTPETRQKLVESCQKYLSKHAGLLYFAAGPICEEAKGGLYVTDFDVALVMFFKSHEALHTYAASADHQKFIAENMASFKGVRVFDADVNGGPAAQ